MTTYPAIQPPKPGDVAYTLGRERERLLALTGFDAAVDAIRLAVGQRHGLSPAEMTTLTALAIFTDLIPRHTMADNHGDLKVLDDLHRRGLVKVNHYVPGKPMPRFKYAPSETGMVVIREARLAMTALTAELGQVVQRTLTQVVSAPPAVPLDTDTAALAP